MAPVRDAQTLSHHLHFFKLINCKINTSRDIRAVPHILQLQNTDVKAIFITGTDH